MDTLESFYRAHYRVVYRYLLSLCGNRSVAEDLASETFLRAIRHIERYDGTCKPTTWLCQIGKNLWLNECRRQRRLVPLEDAAAYDPDVLILSVSDLILHIVYIRQAA